jgi:3-mercaptopropionate dioxygenase
MSIDYLRRFIADMTLLVSEARDGTDGSVVGAARQLLGGLVSHDNWLPDWMARSPAHGYAQNLLWCDPLERFSIVSFVWAPGASTPVHDHLVWGLVGMLRGSEATQPYTRNAATGELAAGTPVTLRPGDVAVVMPEISDIHKVTNLLPDRPSISIHVYGSNIGAVRRHTFDPQTGEARIFVSGYTNRKQPNLWDRSIDARAA